MGFNEDMNKVRAMQGKPPIDPAVIADNPELPPG